MSIVQAKASVVTQVAGSLFQAMEANLEEMRQMQMLNALLAKEQATSAESQANSVSLQVTKQAAQMRSQAVGQIANGAIGLTGAVASLALGFVGSIASKMNATNTQISNLGKWQTAFAQAHPTGSITAEGTSSATAATETEAATRTPVSDEENPEAAPTAETAADPQPEPEKNALVDPDFDFAGTDPDTLTADQRESQINGAITRQGGDNAQVKAQLDKQMQNLKENLSRLEQELNMTRGMVNNISQAVGSGAGGVGQLYGAKAELESAQYNQAQTLLQTIVSLLGQAGQTAGSAASSDVQMATNAAGLIGQLGQLGGISA